MDHIKECVFYCLNGLHEQAFFCLKKHVNLNKILDPFALLTLHKLTDSYVSFVDEKVENAKTSDIHEMLEFVKKNLVKRLVHYLKYVLEVVDTQIILCSEDTNKSLNFNLLKAKLYFFMSKLSANKFENIARTYFTLVSAEIKLKMHRDINLLVLAVESCILFFKEDGNIIKTSELIKIAGQIPQMEDFLKQLNI